MILNTTKHKLIQIHPKYLSNISKYITDQINSMSGMCSKDDGYILNINNIIYDKNFIISRISGHIQINIKYNIEHMKPDISEVLECRVENIYKEGIFCKYKNLMTVFIPSNFLQDWKFCYESMINSNTKKSINIKDTINVKITSIKYDGIYNCIGILE